MCPRRITRCGPPDASHLRQALQQREQRLCGQVWAPAQAEARQQWQAAQAHQRGCWRTELHVRQAGGKLLQWRTTACTASDAIAAGGEVVQQQHAGLPDGSKLLHGREVLLRVVRAHPPARLVQPVCAVPRRAAMRRCVHAHAQPWSQLGLVSMPNPTSCRRRTAAAGRPRATSPAAPRSTQAAAHARAQRHTFLLNSTWTYATTQARPHITNPIRMHVAGLSASLSVVRPDQPRMTSLRYGTAGSAF
jgi:hypothetical protein